LDSRKVNEAGINVDLIDGRGRRVIEDRMDLTLPGASRGICPSGGIDKKRRTKCGAVLA